MACVLGRKGVPVTLVVRREEVVDQINTNHINPFYQSELLLPDTVTATLDPELAFADADYIFHAVPMQYSRKALESVFKRQAEQEAYTAFDFVAEHAASQLTLAEAASGYRVFVFRTITK